MSYTARAGSLRSRSRLIRRLRDELSFATMPAGIPRDAFPRAFRPAVIPPDRSGLSEFGMGMKSAACWFSPRWQVRTKALGRDRRENGQVRYRSYRGRRTRRADIEERPAKTNDHYTEISLQDLHHVPIGRSLGKDQGASDRYLPMLYSRRHPGITVRTGNPHLRRTTGLCAPYSTRTPKATPDLAEGNQLRARRRPCRQRALLRSATLETTRARAFPCFARTDLSKEAARRGTAYADFRDLGQQQLRPASLVRRAHLEGFEVSHTKDGFRWDENEEPFLELLKEHLDSDELPLLRNAKTIARSLKKDRGQAATKALERTGDVSPICSRCPSCGRRQASGRDAICAVVAPANSWPSATWV